MHGMAQQLMPALHEIGLLGNSEGCIYIYIHINAYRQMVGIFVPILDNQMDKNTADKMETGTR